MPLLSALLRVSGTEMRLLELNEDVGLYTFEPSFQEHAQQKKAEQLRKEAQLPGDLVEIPAIILTSESDANAKPKETT